MLFAMKLQGLVYEFVTGGEESAILRVFNHYRYNSPRLVFLK